MSRTIRKKGWKYERDKKDIGEHTYGIKMKQYAKRRGKFAVDRGRGIGVSKTSKLVTKNANRSLKKAMRQESKKVIHDYP